MAAFEAHASFGFWNRQAMGMDKGGDGMGQFGKLTDMTSLPPDAEIAASSTGNTKTAEASGGE